MGFAIFFFSKDGLQFVRAKSEIYIRELKEEFSKGLILPTEKLMPQIITKTVDKQSFQNHIITSPTTSSTISKPVNSGVTKSLELFETFKLPPERLYEILSQLPLVQAWTNSSAKLNFIKGGEFSLINGQISGIIVDYVRFSHFFHIFIFR